MAPVNFLREEELPKICSKSVRRTQPEQYTSLLLQYTIAMAAIANQLNISVDAPGRMFELWTPPSLVQWTSCVEKRLQKFVPRTFVEHSLNYTPVCFSSILLLCKSNDYKCRCSWSDVRTMNGSKLRTSELPAWRGAAKNLFRERSSNTAWATHQFASPVYYCYGSYSKSIECECRCSWTDVRMMNVSKLGTSELPPWRVAAKNLFKKRSSNTDWATH